MTIRRSCQLVFHPAIRLVVLMGLVACAGTGSVQAQPQPDPIPTRWEFEFEPGPLRIALVRSASGAVERYYYMTYRITNYWDADLLFAPDVQLRTDEATVSRSGRAVSRDVTEEVLARLRNPLIEDQIAIVGQVLQGEENARDGVVIWPADDLDVDEVTVFFGGLSGETRVYEVGQGDSQRRFTLRKTMMMRFETPGEFGADDNASLELAEQRWIMR